MDSGFFEQPCQQRKTLKAMSSFVISGWYEWRLSLEESLKTFEEGIKLTRECQQALVKAEQKVKLLIEENGQISEEDFDDLNDPSLDT